MLLSHRFRFIYLKTKKTAGTSVEVYFEPFCLDPDQPLQSVDERATEVSEWGVVAHRRSNERQIWYHHMPAARVRELVGDEVWSGYLKFCVIRNPYDKIVSAFWYNKISDLERERLATAPFQEVRAAFAGMLARTRPTGLRAALSRGRRTTHVPTDRRIIAIRGRLAVDQIIRFETLADDVERVCGILGVPWEPERLQRFKNQYRVRPEPFAAYYDEATLARVRELYAWELDTFGYDEPSLVSPA